MIIATIELWNENTKEDSFDKEFSDTKEMNEWLVSQQGHPFLHYQLMSWRNK